jgi:mRNA-degrading endonuclease toxin of MazEF toxin-antitoxin module
MADQLTTVSKQRLVNYGGELNEAELRQVEQAIRIQLDLR